jgi:superfamily II DNA or RNA helicase
MSCWKCASTNVAEKTVRVGRIRTTAEQILQGRPDENLYQTYIVCDDCDYKCTVAQHKYMRDIVHNLARNTKITEIAARLAAARHPTFVYVLRTSHADLLNMMIRHKLKELGHDPNICRAVHGDLDDESNSAVKEAFIARSVRVVIATSIWGEGTNIPCLRWVIYAKAGKPGIDLEQVIGRALRRAPGKWRAGYVDFKDEFDPTFAEKSRLRSRFLDRKGFKPKMLQDQPNPRRSRYVSVQDDH